MKLPARQQNMLTSFGQFGRNLAYFTTSSSGTMALTPAAAQKNLDELEALGLIKKIPASYMITTAGRNYLDDKAPAETPAFKASVYVPAPWNVRAVAGELSPNGRCA
jgi:DNA-binding MarR family transcriptional regulator